MSPEVNTCLAHPECDRRLRLVEDRLDAIEADTTEKWDKISDAIVELKVGLGSLNGRIAGYLVAASLLGVVVAFLAEYVLRRGP